VSADGDLIDDVLRLAAANGVDVHLATEPEAARGRWQAAALVMIGADLAAAMSGAGLGRRRDVVLVTREPAPVDWQRAVALGAEHVVAVPEAERWLIDRLADSTEGMARDGSVLAVMGCGGGVGASTFAATLALAGAHESLRVLLIDADPLGGGLDVLLGIEEAPGIRWADLAEARGRLGAPALDQALPQVSGVSVLSWGREGTSSVPADVLGSVMDAGVRGYDVVVVDTPRSLGPMSELVLARADRTLLVTANHVRATSAAARLAAELDSRCASVELVLRTDPKGVHEDAVLDALQLPVVARVPLSGGLAARADEGDRPSLRDGYGRACASALALVVQKPGRAA
jgi:secretion/DNA translocation related CpaE-like protein